VSFQFDVLEQDVFEVLRQARSWENSSAPINQIPPEILSTIPDFLGTGDGVIALTHVCRLWRELFVSRPSLWSDFDCGNPDKTRVYLERSKSSPIGLWLEREDDMSTRDPVLQVIPHAIGRLKSLHIGATWEYIETISTHLLHPTPLLEKLSIVGDYNPVLAPTLFNGDLSSLRRLHLEYVRTELPWRNMVNLTSFMLAHTAPLSVGHFLDFFESAPHLREVHLQSGTSISGVQNGRLVPLTCLKMMYTGGWPHSLLFEHLLIPIGVRLTMRIGPPSPSIETVPPRFIDNLKNFSGFTSIRLDHGRMGFSGPNGEVVMVPQVYGACLVFDSLAPIDTSKTERLEIKCGEDPTNSLYRALIPMNDLRTLILTRCKNLHSLIHALHPIFCSPGVVICPRLEKLVIDHDEMFDIEWVVDTAAARASKGAKLKTVRIIILLGAAHPQFDTSELKKHVSHVEFRYTRQ